MRANFEGKRKAARNAIQRLPEMETAKKNCWQWRQDLPAAKEFTEMKQRLMSIYERWTWQAQYIAPLTRAAMEGWLPMADVQFPQSLQRHNWTPCPNMCCVKITQYSIVKLFLAVFLQWRESYQILEKLLSLL